MGKFAFFLLFSFLISFESVTQSLDLGNPQTKTYTINDYQAGPINMSIAQDDHGVLYFGNNYGLLNYDGTRWDVTHFEDALAVLSLFIDANGRIYTGSQADFGFFEPNKQGALEYKSLKNLTTEPYSYFDKLLSIFPTETGVIFYSVSNLFIYENDEVKIVTLEGFNLGAAFFGGNLYLTQQGKGMLTFKNGNFTKVPNTESLANSTIIAVYAGTNNSKIIITKSDGIFKLRGGKLTPMTTSNDLLLRGTDILCSIQDKDNSFLLGTSTAGILYVNSSGEITTQYKKSNGLKSNTVFSILEDKTGNLWLCHNNGISYLELSSPFKFLDESVNVQGSGNTTAIFNGFLYLGTSNGLFHRSLKNDTDILKDKPFSLLPGSQTIILDLVRKKGRLFVGHNTGLALIDSSNNWKQIHDTEGVWKILPTEDENVLILGTYSGIQRVTINEDSIIVKKLEGFDEACRVMEFDQEGNLWMTHGLIGVFRIDLNSNKDSILNIKFYDSNHGFPSNYHINVFKVNDELVFTGKTGIFKYSPEDDRFKPNEKYDDVLGQDLHIRAMEQDELGNIYFWSEEYAGVLVPNGFGAYIKESKPFNKVLRLVDDGIVEYASLNKNDLLIGSNEGFVHYSAIGNTPYLEKYSTLIKRVEVFGKLDSVLYQYPGKYLNEDGAYVFPFSQNSLRFLCSGVFYENKEDMRYQYYVENLDEDWHPWTIKSEKEFVSLREGKYKFHVRSKNIYDVIGEEATFEFEILPPWYRNKIAYLGYAMMIVLMAISIQQFTKRKHVKERKRIETEKEQQIREKESQLQDVSKKSAEEIVRLRNEKLEDEINHKNKELATSTMHLINKNKFLSEVKDGLKKTVKENESSIQKSIELIIEDIEQNIDNIADWEQFSFHFDHVHGDFSKRFREVYPDLTRQDMKIVAYLRMNLSSKEMAQLLHISLRGVEKSRYRLRKKLALSQSENLAEYILNF